MTKQCVTKHFLENKSAVSPVIAVILMVAITVVLAGVVWIWVASMVPTEKEVDVMVMGEFQGRNRNNDYVYVITKATSDEKMGIKNIRFYLLAPDRTDQTNGQHKVENVYGKNISAQTFISFQDGDLDGWISIGDRFIIKSKDHVDDDGTADSPGLAHDGCTFELRLWGTTILRETVKG